MLKEVLNTPESSDDIDIVFTKLSKYDLRLGSISVNNIDAPSKTDRETLLVKAVNARNKGMVKLLVEMRASLHVRDRHYFDTPVAYACKNQDHEMLFHLISLGGDINTRQFFDSSTCLETAIKAQNLQLLETILNMNPSIENFFSIFELAVEVRNEQIGLLLLHFYPDKFKVDGTVDSQKNWVSNLISNLRKLYWSQFESRFYQLNPSMIAIDYSFKDNDHNDVDIDLNAAERISTFDDKEIVDKLAKSLSTENSSKNQAVLVKSDDETNGKSNQIHILVDDDDASKLLLADKSEFKDTSYISSSDSILPQKRLRISNTHEEQTNIKIVQSSHPENTSQNHVALENSDNEKMSNIKPENQLEGSKETFGKSITRYLGNF